jgi:hypothetical protein
MSEGNHQEQDWHPRMESAVPTQEPGGRAFPVWIWGCGGGCLVVLVLLMGAGFWLQSWAQKTFGPEAAWPIVQEVTPYGPEPPEGYLATIAGIGVLQEMLERFGADTEAIEDLVIEQVVRIDRVIDGDTGEYAATYYIFKPGIGPERRVQELRKVASEYSAGGQEIGETRTVEIDFRGRTVEATRFTGVQDLDSQMRQVNAPREVLEIDLSEGRERPVVVQFGGPEPPTEGELNTFFEPFDVWGGK